VSCRCGHGTSFAAWPWIVVDIHELVCRVELLKQASVTSSGLATTVDAGASDATHRTTWLYRVILHAMKTAISVSDETFDRVSRTASDLGMSRSEFFTRAARRYLDELDAQSLTGQIDSALEQIDGIDDAEADAVAMGHRVLDALDDEW